MKLLEKYAMYLQHKEIIDEVSKQQETLLSFNDILMKSTDIESTLLKQLTSLQTLIDLMIKNRKLFEDIAGFNEVNEILSNYFKFEQSIIDLLEDE